MFCVQFVHLYYELYGVVSSGATSCTPCGGGSYSASSTSVCTSCPANSNTQGVTGSQSKSTCVCRPGFTRDGDIDANKSRCVLNYYEELSAGSKTDIAT